MWYEILPSFGIIVVAMGFPHFSAYVINKLILGNGYRRTLIDIPDRLRYLRDRRVSPSGNPYEVIGLEAIPDK